MKTETGGEFMCGWCGLIDFNRKFLDLFYLLCSVLLAVVALDIKNQDSKTKVKERSPLNCLF